MVGDRTSSGSCEEAMPQQHNATMPRNGSMAKERASGSSCEVAACQGNGAEGAGTCESARLELHRTGQQGSVESLGSLLVVVCCLRKLEASAAFQSRCAAVHVFACFKDAFL